MDEDISLATFNAFLSLLRVLHRKKVIHVDEVVADFGDVIDFANARKIEVPQKATQMAIYQALERFARTLGPTEP